MSAALAAVCGCAMPIAAPRVRAAKLASTDCGSAWLVSFPEVGMDAGERIIALGIKLENGRVIAVNSIPEDWSLEVEAGPAHAKLAAAVLHGAAALDSTSALTNFATVCAMALPDATFSIEGSLLTTVDFASTRERAFEAHDLQLAPIELR